MQHAVVLSKVLNAAEPAARVGDNLHLPHLAAVDAIDGLVPGHDMRQAMPSRPSEMQKTAAEIAEK